MLRATDPRDRLCQWSAHAPSDTLSPPTRTVRSAQDCHDRADALSRSAADCADPGLSQQIAATAQQWRWLAAFAHRQDALLLSLEDPANAASSG